MKTINKVLCFLFIMGALNYNVYGQFEVLTDALETIMDTEGAQDNEEADELTTEQQEWIDKLKEALEKDKKNLAGLNLSSNLMCGYLMAKYYIAYGALKQKTESTSECKKKYDLYGMQAAAIGASTTIMYCPEGIVNLTEDEQGQLKKDWTELQDRARAEFKRIEGEWQATIPGAVEAVNVPDFSGNRALLEVYFTILYLEHADNILLNWDEVMNFRTIVNHLEGIANFYHPINILQYLLKINEEMSALPCARK